jgi:hypothetical protein
MRLYSAQYGYRKTWGHTVYLQDEIPENYGETVDPDEQEEIVHWTNKNAVARRIAYDEWQFTSRQDAEHFIMLFNLRWP